MFCLECGCDMAPSTDPITEVYRGESIVAEGIEHYVCPKCGEYSISAEGSKKLSRALVNAFAERQGLLTPDQIVALRKKCNLNQADFQKALGVTGVTASRWETGRTQQTKPVDNLMRMMDKHPCVALDLMQRAEVGEYGRVIENSTCVFRNMERTPQPKLTFTGGAK